MDLLSFGNIKKIISVTCIILYLQQENAFKYHQAELGQRTLEQFEKILSQYDNESKLLTYGCKFEEHTQSRKSK